MTDPVRIVTSSVRVSGSDKPVVSVRTASPIPKGKIDDCIEAMKGLTVEAPVKIGDVLMPNVAGTGTDLIASADA